MILSTLIDESIIPGMGQWHTDTLVSFLWVLWFASGLFSWKNTKSNHYLC